MAATFANLLRNSKFVELGDFAGRLLIGRVVHRVNEDLYIDFGLKFNAICKRPEKDGELPANGCACNFTSPSCTTTPSSPFIQWRIGKYVIGSKVLIRLHDPELSERFLGSRTDITLLEADAHLLGLYKERKNQRRGQQRTHFDQKNTTPTNQKSPTDQDQ